VAISSIDASENNLQSYYSMIHDTYKRYLPTAEAFGIAYTPAMETAVMFPAGTTMDSAYIRTYSFGYVEVPY